MKSIDMVSTDDYLSFESTMKACVYLIDETLGKQRAYRAKHTTPTKTSPTDNNTNSEQVSFFFYRIRLQQVEQIQ
jgi:hypothetical protein